MNINSQLKFFKSKGRNASRQSDQSSYDGEISPASLNNNNNRQSYATVMKPTRPASYLIADENNNNKIKVDDKPPVPPPMPLTTPTQSQPGTMRSIKHEIESYNRQKSENYCTTFFFKIFLQQNFLLKPKYFFST